VRRVGLLAFSLGGIVICFCPRRLSRGGLALGCQGFGPVGRFGFQSICQKQFPLRCQPRHVQLKRALCGTQRSLRFKCARFTAGGAEFRRDSPLVGNYFWQTLQDFVLLGTLGSCFYALSGWFVRFLFAVGWAGDDRGPDDLVTPAV
jgi:hypothetical protein